MYNKLLMTVVISCLIILIAKCDTNDHFQHIINRTQNYSLRQIFQEKYDKVLAFFANNEFYLNVYATFIWTQLVYWVIGSLYTILDLTKWPQFLYKYKIQETEISFSQIVPILKQVVINQILVGFWMVMLTHYAFVWRGSDTSPILPQLSQIMIQLFAFVVIEEIGFYYTHRLLHNRHIYKYVHKIHHEWQSPIAITAVYCHPFEYIFSNLLPLVLGPIILGSHRITFWIWLTLALIVTLNDHSGYHFPLMPSPEFHDFHHLKFTQNFGLLGILDRIHSTDSVFRKAIAFKRHKILTNLVPLKLAIPDKL